MVDLFETMEFDKDGPYPVLLPVCLFPGPRQFDPLVSTRYGYVRRTPDDGLVPVAPRLAVGEKGERLMAANMLRWAARVCDELRGWDFEPEDRVVRAGGVEVFVSPRRAGLYRVVRGNKSAFVVLDPRYVQVAA